MNNELCPLRSTKKTWRSRLMHHVKKILLGTIATLIVVVGCATAKNTVKKSDKNNDPRWAKIDSLRDLGQYASALTLTEALLESAQATNDWRTEFRAWMYRATLQQATGVDRKETIAALEARAATAGVPLKQLLHSVIGASYWRWYQDERWQVLQRTELAEAGTDPDAWDQATFMRKVIAEYRASLEPHDTLKQIPVRDLGALLLPEDAAAKADLRLRPTVYDVLAHRALDIFGNSETRLAEPAWRFQLNDPRYFNVFDGFAYISLAHRDSTAWEWQALQVYQRLERQHISDTDPDALVDVTLDRLRFVHDRSTLPNKDTLHLEALKAMRTRLPKNPCEGEVMVTIAHWHEQQAAKYQRLGNDDWKWEKKTAVDQCKEVLAKWPGTFGATNAEALISRLTQPTLAVQVEEATAPEARSKVALTYANVKRVWLRIVSDPGEDGRFTPYRSDAAQQALLKRTSVHEWSVELADDGDLNTHMVELPVEGLPMGRYQLIASNEEAFMAHRSMIVMASMNVTRLALASRQLPGNKASVLVTDRISGAPLQGAKADLYMETWRNNGRSRDLIGTATTDADGMATVALKKASNGSQTWEVTVGNEQQATNVYAWYREDGPDTDTLRTFLFTDRAIYRPGQEIHFKGIITAKRGGTTATKSGYKSTVIFTNANGEEVSRKEVLSDAFGSFSGTFTAPQGVLTGQMTLSEEHGGQSIRVEEYKRPTFEVDFDPVTSAAKLEQQATVTGVARSYAGVPLDGAQVQWKVMREARMPWWCGTFWRSIIPWGRPTEVASGTTTTDGTGAFNVAFLAQADKAVARAADPTFVFTVEADVTDINGETQHSSTQLSVGYRSIDIALEVGDAIDRRTTDSLHVGVNNLNGQPMDVPMGITITKVDAPEVPLRDRAWERPDRFVLTAPEHALQFPGWVYANEDDPLTWPQQEVLLARKAWRSAGKALVLDGIDAWDVGSYVIQVAATDADGRAVTARKFITLYDTAVRNTGFVHNAFHVEPVKARVEPGDKAVLLLSSALPTGHVLMEVERNGAVAVRRWFTLADTQQRIELPAMESDRGGFTVHFICVERGREHRESIFIDVPWTNKELRAEWMTFRDKLLPGAKEEWRLRITGSKGDKVAAQLLTAMYDASLDHFVPHGWGMGIWQQRYAECGWSQVVPFGTQQGQPIWRTEQYKGDSAHSYPDLNTFGFDGLFGYGRHEFRSGVQAEAMVWDAPLILEDSPGQNQRARTVACPVFGDAEGGGSGKEKEQKALMTSDATQEDHSAQPVRSDFRETAFFFPDLLTDKDGAVILRFTMPEALTRWKLLGLAHTTDLQVASFTKETITQKPVMVVPNLPRFLRAGDRITLTSKINALENAVNGTAKLELFDPFTNASLNSGFNLKDNARTFTAAPGKSANASWDITVPENVSIVAVRITAGGASFSDGEEKPLPVLTDKVLVTESLPLWSNKAGTKTFTLDKLKNNTSTTLRTQALKLEYTPNPAWFAVQALPYLMEFPHACAEQTFSRFYANSLAASIVDKRPAIKQVFAAWSSPSPREKGLGDEVAFLSALERNADLKSAVLEETPWVLNARSERESKQRVALLFDLQRMSSEQDAALKKLGEMQLRNGAWPWWSGMRESRYITQHIVAGFGHLEKLDAADLRPDGQTQQMIRSAVRWLDGDMERDYKELVRTTKKEEREKYAPGSLEIHYLYARSFFPRWTIDGATRTAVDFYLKRLKETWLANGLQEQAMIALAMDRLGEKATAGLIMKSLGERATRTEELGMYWKDFRGGYDWWSFPTETHALMIEAFNDVAKDAASVNELRTYLLKLKQTTDWKTTKATSEACYALLLSGDDRLTETAAPVITVGNVTVGPPKGAEAGTGTFEHNWAPAEVKPAMGEVTITSTVDKPGWGALHWQYLEQMDKVTPHESPFSIRKQVLLKQPTDGGPQLIALDKARALKAGDEVTIRIELRTDRYVDYVHLKDLRAAGLEPTDVLSGYTYQGGLGYYRTIRDASVNFFFDRIAPGTYVFEYNLRVSHAGDFSNGITTAMCMYAPEFSSHSEGVRINVKP